MDVALRLTAPRREIDGWQVLAVLAAATGCTRSDNPQTYPVAGKVTYRGQPVTSGMVMLTPEESGHAATGSLEKDGSFKLTTFQKDDGAVPGRYQVAVQAFPAEGAGLPGAEFAGKAPPIPQKYFSPGSSGLTVEIKAGENQLDLALKD
jgi:hypothetical protein